MVRPVVIFSVLAAGGFAVWLTFDRKAGARVQAVGLGVKSVAQTVTALAGGYDAMIAAQAKSAGIPPNILKAIVRQESNFTEAAINPEKDFTLDGVSYAASSKAGRAALRSWILAGNDPRVLGLNPSIGLAQVRVKTARKVLGSPRLTAAELFKPEVNLRASAALLAELLRAGITLETIDAYNVGQDLQPRNLAYRDRVRGFAKQYEADFR